MMRQIKESDWKVLRQLEPVALDRFCQRVLFEIKRISEDEAKSAHTRYSEIYALTRRRDKEIARTFNDLRRSTAFYQLASMKGLDLLTEEEFLRFSQETRTVVEVLLS